MKVVIHSPVYAKIMAWVQECKIECSGLGKVKRMPNGEFHVVDAMLLKQECNAVHTTLDAQAIGKAMFEMKDTEGDLNWWWHSHVDMPCQWSGTDHSTMDSFTDDGYVLSTVFNKKHDTRSAYTQKSKGVFPDLFTDNIPTQIKYLVTAEEKKAWKKELDEKVTEEVSVMGTGFGWQGTSSTSSEPAYGDDFYKEYCDKKKEMVWPWQLHTSHHQYFSHAEFIDYYKFDPLAKAKAKEIKEKATAAIKAGGKSKGDSRSYARVQVPFAYKNSKIIPAKKVQNIFDTYIGYFKHTPTITELEDFYIQNLKG